MSELTRHPAPRAHRLLALACFLAATYLVAATSSIFTVSAIPTWYAALAKPSFNPPNHLFGPVWTVLYTLMAVAAWLVWKRPASVSRSRGLLLFWVQLALNFAWSLTFFRGHALIGSLVEIVLLWLAILATMLVFFRISRVAGSMLAPYLAWVSFAGVLNWEIWRLNQG